MMLPTSEEPITFTVRPQPRGTSLEGAFRIHLATKDLDLLGIKPGELCHLLTAEGASGTGIAWRSTEPTTKTNTHPVKLTDIFRDAFNFKLGTHLTITKSTNPIFHANRVVVTDVSDHGSSDHGSEGDLWKWDVGSILNHAEAIANNIAFEVTSRKGLRKRYLIENISAGYKTTNALFFFDGKTELILQDESAGLAPSPRMSNFSLHHEGIGGLSSQLQWLHRRLEMLVGEIEGRKLPRDARSNNGILLYGPPGTGKSLILERICNGPWRKVVRIDQSRLAGPLSKNQATVNALVSEAISSQPCIIIMDDLHLLASSNMQEQVGSPMAQVLSEELVRLRNTQVLLIAAAPHPSDVHRLLRKPNIILHNLEIPVPGTAGRIGILHALHEQSQGNGHEFDDLAMTVAERTHAFVGSDLDALYKLAKDYAITRFIDEQWALPSRNGSDSPRTLVDEHLSARPSVSTMASVESRALESANVRPSLVDFERALLQVRPSAMQEVMLETPKVYWADIGGAQEVQRLLTRAVELPLKHSALMKRFNVKPTKGVLLYGPPGCSKTLTAKAVATSSGLNFLAVKGPELTSMYVGESERAIREVFRKARAAAPSIIFFDEIESIAKGRTMSAQDGLHTLTTLLNEMDGIESLEGVLVLAATNRPEVIDDALLRPGRFDHKIYVGPPNEAARAEILSIATREVAHLASDIDINELAHATKGFSGAELVNACNEAATTAMMRAMEGQPEELKAEDLRAAIAATAPTITEEMVAQYELWRAHH